MTGFVIREEIVIRNHSERSYKRRVSFYVWNITKYNGTDWQFYNVRTLQYSHTCLYISNKQTDTQLVCDNAFDNAFWIIFCLHAKDLREAVPWEISENSDCCASLVIQWQWPVRQRSRLDYQPLFGKWARPSSPDQKRRMNKIMHWRHRHDFPLTRPAVLLGKGRPDKRERRKSSLSAYWTNKICRLSVQFLSCLSPRPLAALIGTRYRGFAAFLARSNCLKTAKLRRLLRQILQFHTWL